MKTRRTILCGLAAAIMLAFIACDNGGGDPPKKPQTETPQTPGGDMTWTAVRDTSIFGESSIECVAFGGGKFVTVGDDGKIAYSTDGIKWIAVTNSPFRGSKEYPYVRIKDIAWGGGKFVVLWEVNDGYDGDVKKMAYSSDGITWTDVVFDFDEEFDFNINSVAYGNGKFVVVGQYTDIIEVWYGNDIYDIFNKIAYSTDGVTWTPAKFSLFDSIEKNKDDYQDYLKNYGDSITNIVFGGDKFIVYDKYTKKMAYSTDGVTWTAVNVEFNAFYSGSYDDIKDIAWGGGKFVAVGNYRAAYSSDGITWTAVANSSKEAVEEKKLIEAYSIAYGGGKFVATGPNGSDVYSTDGVTWTRGKGYAAMTIDNTTSSWGFLPYNDIAYGNGRFVAVGHAGDGMTQLIDGFTGIGYIVYSN